MASVMETMTPEQRLERARKAAITRWVRHNDWRTLPLDEAKERLVALRAEVDSATDIILLRISREEQPETVPCYNPSCRKPIDIHNGRFACSRTRNNRETGLPETAYACSSACWLWVSQNFLHSSTTVSRANPADPTPSAMPPEPLAQDPVSTAPKVPSPTETASRAAADATTATSAPSSASSLSSSSSAKG